MTLKMTSRISLMKRRSSSVTLSIQRRATLGTMVMLMKTPRARRLALLWL
jgi:hypothetical protein